MRRTIIIVVSALGLLLFIGLITPSLSGPGTPAAFVRAMVEVKNVGIAAHLYADDHQGRLPETLDDLVPNYLPNDAYFSRTRTLGSAWCGLMGAWLMKSDDDAVASWVCWAEEPRGECALAFTRFRRPNKHVRPPTPSAAVGGLAGLAKH